MTIFHNKDDNKVKTALRMSRRTFQKKEMSLMRTTLIFFLMSILCMTQTVSADEISSYPYLFSHGVNFGTGNLYLAEQDVNIKSGIRPLAFRRAYNSQSTANGLLGFGWSAPFLERVMDDGENLTLVRDTGRHIKFISNGKGAYHNPLGRQQTIVRTSAGFKLTGADGKEMTFDTKGRLVLVVHPDKSKLAFTWSGEYPVTMTDDFGRTFSFTCASGKLSAMTTPVGTVTYAYDQHDNPISVTGPGNRTRTYRYEDPNDVHNLTGIVDTSGTLVRFVMYNSRDQVYRTAFANDRDSVTILYPKDLVRVIHDSLGQRTTYQLEVMEGVVRVASYTRHEKKPQMAPSNETTEVTQSYAYSNRQQVRSQTDALGTVTDYTHDDKGNRLTRTRASGTPIATTTATTWHPDFAKPLTITEPSATPGKSRVTTYTYDDKANPLTHTVSGWYGDEPVSATTTYTYDDIGRLTAIDGPRTDVRDVTTFTWYPNTADQGANRSQLHTVTDAMGNTTAFGNYTASGKPGTLTDTNGLTTTFTYNLQGQVIRATTDGMATTYERDVTGRVTAIKIPDAGSLSLAYTGDQITNISDAAGNAIHYTHDTKGRTTRQDVQDSGQTLTRSLSLAYSVADNLSRLIFPDQAVYQFQHDAVNNLIQVIDPTGLQTRYDRDRLGRILSISRGNARTSAFAYDSQGNLISETDAKGRTTTYTYDDLGHVRSVSAPDTGLVRYTYDAAGNLATLTTAKNQTIAYTYDALDRLIAQTVPDAKQPVIFTYDTASAHQFSHIRDAEENRSFAYNDRGQLTEEKQMRGDQTISIKYAYTPAGQLAAITYPSGKVLGFVRSKTGEITALTLDGKPLVTGMTYLPFGPVKTLSTGTVTQTRTYDQRYQISRIQAGSLDLAYTRDLSGKVTAINGMPAPSASAADGTEPPALKDTGPDSEKNSGIQPDPRDANGNMRSDGTYDYTWDALNRLVRLSLKPDNMTAATYAYDSQNRRIRKTIGSLTVHYHYDVNDLLIAETLPDGTVLREYFYFSCQPVAMWDYADHPGLYYYVNDYLNAPVQLITPTGKVVWQAEYLDFGKARIRIHQVTNNLRRPGQYYDTETGLHYHWDRYYNPSTGKYISAPPI